MRNLMKALLAGNVNYSSEPVQALTATDREAELEVLVRSEKPLVLIKQADAWLLLTPAEARSLATALIEASSVARSFGSDRF